MSGWVSRLNHNIYCKCTLFTTGVALLYLQLHRVSQEASHLQRALDYVKRTMRILNGRKVTFLCGDAGPLAVGAVVHHKLNNTADSKDCLSRWVALTVEMSMDMTHYLLVWCIHCWFVSAHVICILNIEYAQTIMSWAGTNYQRFLFKHQSLCVSVRLLQLQRSVLSPDAEMPDELLYGRAGYLYALLYVNKEIGADTVDESTIIKVRHAYMPPHTHISTV